MVNFSYFNIFTIILFFSLMPPSKVYADKKTYIWCVPVKKIDLNPFRELNDGKELAYWMLLRSYISTDPTEPGLLEAYEFSPNGKVFLGRISESAKWNDGTRLSSREAAIGIVKGFKFRQMNEKVRGLGNEDMSAPGWQSRIYKSIRIIDDRNFEIHFESSVENLTGILREALSSSSRHNRIWPIRFGQYEQPQAIAKFPYEYEGDSIVFKVGSHRVKLVNSPECKKVDFTIYPDGLDLDLSLFDGKQNAHPQAITVQTNTAQLALQEREEIINWIRKASSSAPQNTGIQLVSSFFLPGESGYDPDLKWEDSRLLSSLRRRTFKIGIEGPVMRKILETAALVDNLKIEIINLPTSEQQLDAQILNSGIKQGRHIILQDILKWAHVPEMMQFAPKTIRSLKKISERSASTIPPNNYILKEFQKVAKLEQSLAPIARRFTYAYSKKDAPIYLDWTITGEMTFRVKNSK